MIESGKKYRIRGNSQYFNRKYGTPNPIIIIEGPDITVFGMPWYEYECWATDLFTARIVLESLPKNGFVFYGHVDGLGELVVDTELEEIKE
jgi:hypothetical protein